MTRRYPTLLALTAGLWMAHPMPGQEPARIHVESSRALETPPASSANQRSATAIADHLKQSGRLQDYRIAVTFQNGAVELSGSVADAAQRDEALRLVQGVPGVDRVRDRLTIIKASAVTQAQATEPRLTPIPAPTPVPGPAPTTPPATSAPPATSGTVEPAPVYQTPNPSFYDLNPPKMPPYAWPTYAPYNNYSRVAYPTLYPYNSWPFIGPCYPFPQVPLGWRSVKLTWEDGYWWYSRHSTSHDWWRLRYW